MALVTIGRIVDPGRAVASQPLTHRPAGKTDQRPKHENPSPLGPGGRRRPFFQTALAQHGVFGLVRGGVSGDDDAGASGPRRLGQQAVTRVPRGGRQSAGGIGTAPGERAGLSAQVLRGSGGESGPLGALRLQAMIDDERDNGPTMLARPGEGQAQGQEGIGAAGKGHGERVSRPRFQPPVERRKVCVFAGLGRASRVQVQRARVRAALAWVFSAVVALG